MAPWPTRAGRIAPSVGSATGLAGGRAGREFVRERAERRLPRSRRRAVVGRRRDDAPCRPALGRARRNGAGASSGPRARPSCDCVKRLPQAHRGDGWPSPRPVRRNARIGRTPGRRHRSRCLGCPALQARSPPGAQWSAHAAGHGSLGWSNSPTRALGRPPRADLTRPRPPMRDTVAPRPRQAGDGRHDLTNDPWHTATSASFKSRS